MKKITILLTKYSDWISNLVYIMEGGGYTHASLGLEEEEDTPNHLKKINTSWNFNGSGVN